MDVTFETLVQLLKNDDNTPFTNYIVEDYDGNQIYSEDLFILDWYAMREWKVNAVCIDEFGRAVIVLNSGNFHAFHFRNVRQKGGRVC